MGGYDSEGFDSEEVVIERGRCLAITREEAFGDSEGL